MYRAIPTPLPGVDTDRIAVRIAEAMAIGREPSKLREFPEWTQRIMLILNRQFVPKEFESILSADMSVFTEGGLYAYAKVAGLTGW